MESWSLLLVKLKLKKNNKTGKTGRILNSSAQKSRLGCRLTVVNNFYNKPNEIITNEPEHEDDLIGSTGVQ